MNTKLSFKMLGGFKILNTNAESLCNTLDNNLKHERKSILLFANTNFIVKCQELKSALNKDEVYIVNDGIGVDIAAKITSGSRFSANLNGTDFFPYFLSHLGNAARVYLLGAQPGIALQAAESLRTRLQVNVVGVRNGYEESINSEEILNEIQQLKANVILVAKGNPLQEEWIVNHLQQLPAPCVISGVGALLDFLSGRVSRAPKIVIKLRLEWLYRLLLEPKRLLKRYTLDIIIFLKICLSQRKSSPAD